MNNKTLSVVQKWQRIMGPPAIGLAGVRTIYLLYLNAWSSKHPHRDLIEYKLGLYAGYLASL